MKQFLIPGSPKDYYVALKNDIGIVEYSALRGKVRQLVEIYSECIKEVIASGGNPHTASLDMSDVLNDFMAKEPPEAQTAFYTMYSQEMDAATSTTLDNTNKLITETAKSEANLMQIGQWIGALVIFLVVLAFLMH